MSGAVLTEDTTALQATVDRRKSWSLTVPALLVGDVVNLGIGVFLGALIQGVLTGVWPDLESLARTAPFLAVAFIGALRMFDLYRPQRMSTRKAVRSIVRPIGLSAVFVATLALLSNAFSSSQIAVAAGLPLAGVLVLLWRGAAHHLENRLRGREHLLVLVDTDVPRALDQLASLLRLVEATENHLELVDIVDYREVGNIPAAAKGVDLVVITAAVPDQARSSLMSQFIGQGISVFLVPSPSDVALTTSVPSHFHAIDGLLVEVDDISPGTAFVKRVMDVSVSAISLIVLLPVILTVALAVRLESPGEVIFRQKRVGRDGKVFTLFKFRSMRHDAEASTGAILATADDPRVTKVGSFLRKSRLDEIPQLWNVLIGEMSLVGPRPERPEFVSGFNKEVESYSRRFLIRPGITGLAQVRGGYSATVEEKLRYDLFYVGRCSIALDFRIAVQTLATMLDFTAADGTVDVDIRDVADLKAVLSIVSSDGSSKRSVSTSSSAETYAAWGSDSDHGSVANGSSTKGAGRVLALHTKQAPAQPSSVAQAYSNARNAAQG